MKFTLLRFDSIDSTNTEALRQARAGAFEGLAIVASEQTAGRGRNGRTWNSEENSGLYLSIVLRPQIEPRFFSLITLMSAVVVSDTLSQGFGLRPDIKWPNDILINAKKISGILAETTDTPNGLAIVVGIGINIVSSNVPNELAESATSLRAELSSDRRATAAGLTNMSGRDGQQILSEIEQQLLHFFDYWYDALRQRKGPENIIEAWRDRSSYFSGRPVMVTLTNGSVVGTTDGLEPNGALRIRRDDGTVAIIHSGDVFSLRGKAV